MVMYATLVVFQRDLDSIALLVGQVATSTAELCLNSWLG